MRILNCMTFAHIEVDEEKLTPEIVELLREYNDYAQEAREALRKRDIAMLNIMAKTKMTFVDFLKDVIIE